MRLLYVELLTTTEPKIFHSNILKDTDNNRQMKLMNNEYNELLAKHALKIRLETYCPNIRRGTIFKSNQIKIYIFFYMIFKVVINLLYASYIVTYGLEDDLECRL